MTLCLCEQARCNGWPAQRAQCAFRDAEGRTALHHVVRKSQSSYAMQLAMRLLDVWPGAALFRTYADCIPGRFILVYCTAELDCTSNAPAMNSEYIQPVQPVQQGES